MDLDVRVRKSTRAKGGMVILEAARLKRFLSAAVPHHRIKFIDKDTGETVDKLIWQKREAISCRDCACTTVLRNDYCKITRCHNAIPVSVNSLDRYLEDL